MSYENGCNIGNAPDCPECEAYEKEIERLKTQIAEMVTIDEIEAWHTYLRNIGEIAWVERNLRSPRFGLDAHRRRET